MQPKAHYIFSTLSTMSTLVTMSTKKNKKTLAHIMLSKIAISFAF